MAVSTDKSSSMMNGRQSQDPWENSRVQTPRQHPSETLDRQNVSRLCRET